MTRNEMVKFILDSEYEEYLGKKRIKNKTYYVFAWKGKKTYIYWKDLKNRVWSIHRDRLQLAFGTRVFIHK